MSRSCYASPHQGASKSFQIKLTLLCPCSLPLLSLALSPPLNSKQGVPPIPDTQHFPLLSINLTGTVSLASVSWIMAAVSFLQTIFHLQPSGLNPPQRPTYVIMLACLPEFFFFFRIINVPLYKLAKVTGMLLHVFDLKSYKVNPIAKFYGTLST